MGLLVCVDLSLPASWGDPRCCGQLSGAIFPVHQVNIAIMDIFFRVSAVLRIQHYKRVYPKQTPLSALAHLRCVSKPKTHHRYTVTPNLHQGLCSGFVSWGCWNTMGAVPWRREKGMPEPASHCPVQLPRGVGRPAAIQLGLAQRDVALLQTELPVLFESCPMLAPNREYHVSAAQEQTYSLPSALPQTKALEPAIIAERSVLVTIFQPSQSTICSTSILKREKRGGHYRCVLRKR